MVIVTGLIEVAPGSVEAAKQAATIMAQATRHEHGCQVYAFYQDIENPARFRVYEEWDDDLALESHFQTPHMAVFRDTLQKLDVVSRNVVKRQAGEALPL